MDLRKVMMVMLGISLIASTSFAQQTKPVQIKPETVGIGVWTILAAPMGGRGGGNPGEGGEKIVEIEVDGIVFNIADLVNVPPKELKANLEFLFKAYNKASLVSVLTSAHHEFQPYSRKRTDYLLAKMLRNLAFYQVIEFKTFN